MNREVEMCIGKSDVGCGGWRWGQRCCSWYPDRAFRKLFLAEVAHALSVRPDLSSQEGIETMPLSSSSYYYVLFINPVWFMASDGY